MINEMRDFVLELVQSEYETGHRLAEDRNEFNELCRDEGYRATKAMYDLYEECHNLGPAGFYAEYKDELDFDPDFVAEYVGGDGLDEDDYETAERYYVYGVRGNVESDEFEYEDDAIEWAKENNHPTVKVHKYFYDESGKIRPDGAPEVIWTNDQLEEALSNKEKLKRAYPELNFGNPVNETLNEAVDVEDKMQTAVGILYDMDNFVLSVYDNGYWLSMGVPDGEFSEDDRDLAEANCDEHIWLIEGDEEGSFDREAFADLLDAFETATDDSDYDQNERARIIHEAEVILNMNESIEDMDKRCEECNTLLNDMGKCPKCDEGEEDKLDEAVLNEVNVAKAVDKQNRKMQKDIEAKAKAIGSLIVKTLNNDNKYYYKNQLVDYETYANAVKGVADIINDGAKLRELDPNSATYNEISDIINTAVINKDGWVVRRGLELIKPGYSAYRADRTDSVKVLDRFAADTVLATKHNSSLENKSEPASNPAEDTSPANDEATPATEAPVEAPAPATNVEPEILDTAKVDNSWINNDSIKATINLIAKRKNGSVNYYDKEGKLVDYRTITTDNISDIFADKEATKPFVDVMMEVKAGLAKRKAAAIKSAALFGESFDDSMDYEYQESIDLDESLTTDEFNDLMTLAKELGMKTIGEIQQFADRELADGEKLLDAMKRYKAEIDGDIEPLDEEFSENVLEEEFTNYAEIRSKFEENQINYGQREAFEEMLAKGCKALNSDPELVLIYEDFDREFDPIYFADDSKQLQHNVFKVRVFDLDIVRIEFKGTIYIVFKNQADADIYMNYAH